jgi:cell cycle checkpoint protein
MGMLHSLPSPVLRCRQKLFKPEFFNYLMKEKDVWDVVRDVRGWIVEDAVARVCLLLPVAYVLTDSVS